MNDQVSQHRNCTPFIKCDHILAVTQEKWSSGFATRSDTNRPIQLQKMGRSLEFGIYEDEEFYYQCSKNKGADQLCSYCTADLRLCFRLSKNLVFSCRSSSVIVFITPSV